jgi:hypothetical protein
MCSVVSIARNFREHPKQEATRQDDRTEVRNEKGENYANCEDPEHAAISRFRIKQLSSRTQAEERECLQFT